MAVKFDIMEHPVGFVLILDWPKDYINKAKITMKAKTPEAYFEGIHLLCEDVYRKYNSRIYLCVPFGLSRDSGFSLRLNI